MTTVRVATINNVVLSNEVEAGDIINGVVLSLDDLILIKNQTIGTENGVYMVNNTGIPTRVINYRIGIGIGGEIVCVVEGTVDDYTKWICTNQPGSDIVGTDSLVFVNSRTNDFASFVRNTTITGITNTSQVELTWQSIDSSFGNSITLIGGRINLVPIGTYIVTVDVEVEQTGSNQRGNFRSRIFFNTTGLGTPIHSSRGYTRGTNAIQGGFASMSMTKIITTTVIDQVVSIWGINITTTGAVVYSVLTEGFKASVMRLA